jgi:hypothetical protein
MIYLIDYVIDSITATKIEQQSLSLHFPWHYTPDTSYGNANTYQQRPGFLHWYMKNGQEIGYEETNWDGAIGDKHTTVNFYIR